MSPSPTHSAAPARIGSAVTLAVLVALLAVLLPSPPASAASQCFTDAAADVENRADQSPAEEPRADILAVCVDYDGQVLDLTLRVAQPTDPATNPAWADAASAVGYAIDTDGVTTEEATDRAPAGEEFTVNLANFSGNGPFQARTMVGGTNDTATDAQGAECVHPATFDGTRYRSRIPAGCLGNPPDVRVAAFIFFESTIEGQESTGRFDEVPTFPEYLETVDTSANPATAVQRLAGPARVETSITVSQDDFAEGAATSVVLARADASPDALSGAPLAVAQGGPLLLTARDSLPASVEAEIQRVLPAGGTVYLSGGTAAIEESVADRVRALGYTVVRAAGVSRYATSVEVARATTQDPALIVVADGNDFPDALVGGALAATEEGVQILSNGDALDDTAQGYLAEHPDAEVVAVGPQAAAAVPDATPLVGSDVFATSVVVAERYGDVDAAAMASGTNFPDGLSGGAHAGRAGVPLLLSLPDVLPQSITDYLQAQGPLGSLVMYGGTAALSYTVEEDAATAAFG